MAEAVNASFVAAWVNRGPGFRNLDFNTEKWIFQGDLEAYPTKNICTFFLTPEGKVFYYAAGSYSPEIFLEILANASALRGELFDAAMKEKGGLAAKLHHEKAEAYEALREKAKDATTSPDGWRKLMADPKGAANYRGLKHKHSQRCAWSLQHGYAYFVDLHRTLAEWKELPAFEDLRFSYLYGNEFTEETADAARIGRREEPPPPPPPAAPKTSRASGKGGGDAFGLGLPGINLGPLQPE